MRPAGPGRVRLRRRPMRRFVKTFTVKRHVQYTVVQEGDGAEPRFEILRWAAADAEPEKVAEYGYLPARPDLMDAARNKAIDEAQRLADAEQAGRAAQHGDGR